MRSTSWMLWPWVHTQGQTSQESPPRIPGNPRKSQFHHLSSENPQRILKESLRILKNPEIFWIMVHSVIKSPQNPQESLRNQFNIFQLWKNPKESLQNWRKSSRILKKSSKNPKKSLNLPLTPKESQRIVKESLKINSGSSNYERIPKNPFKIGGNPQESSKNA